MRRIQGTDMQSTAVTESSKLTPELVQAIADKVIAMWQRDMEIERERQRPFGQRSTNWQETR